MMVRDSQDRISVNSRLNRSNVHQASGQSLIGSSGEVHTAIITGPNTQLKVNRVQSNLEDSTAHAGRPPIHLPGLTDFLRKEYYRRMGIYLNGGRKEEGLLLNFWKDHVSEAYKNLNAQKKEQQKIENQVRRQKELMELQKTDPIAYRRIMNEKEAKEKAALEKLEREEKIKMRQMQSTMQSTVSQIHAKMQS